MPEPNKPNLDLRDKWTERSLRSAANWNRPLVVALAIGAVLGIVFGLVAGNVTDAGALSLGLPSLGDIGGPLLGLVVAVLFVGVAFLAYRLIRNAITGAVVLGLLAMAAMGLVGGLFGAVVGLIAGLLLGAFVGATKAQGGLVVGDVAYPARAEFDGPRVVKEPLLPPRRRVAAERVNDKVGP